MCISQPLSKKIFSMHFFTEGFIIEETESAIKISLTFKLGLEGLIKYFLSPFILSTTSLGINKISSGSEERYFKAFIIAEDSECNKGEFFPDIIN